MKLATVTDADSTVVPAVVAWNHWPPTTGAGYRLQPGPIHPAIASQLTGGCPTALIVTAESAHRWSYGTTLASSPNWRAATNSSPPAVVPWRTSIEQY